MIWILSATIILLFIILHTQKEYIENLSDRVTELEDKIDKPYEGTSEEGFPFTIERKLKDKNK